MYFQTRKADLKDLTPVELKDLALSLAYYIKLQTSPGLVSRLEAVEDEIVRRFIEEPNPYLAEIVTDGQRRAAQ